MITVREVLVQIRCEILLLSETVITHIKSHIWKV